jgi:endoglucanase
MNTDRLARLKSLIATQGPSGYEREVAAVWRDLATDWADEVDRDRTGNSYAWVRVAEDAPTVLVNGHIDEIGIQVNHIDPEGYIWFDEIGGWDPQIIVGQRVIFRTETGEVRGLVARKAAHLLKPEDRDKAVKLTDLWVDIGARTRDEALTRIGIGDAGVVEQPFVHLTDDLVSSRALDNRVSAFIASEVARVLAADRPAVNVVAVATTQEETSFGGAYTSTHRVNPLIAIAIDLTHSTDYPGGDKKRNDLVDLGSGPCLARGASINPVVYDRFVAAAKSNSIPYTVQGSARYTWTDADAMIKSGDGPATACISVPGRYMHSPNETVSLSDIEHTIDLIVAFIRDLAPDTDVRP